MDKLSPNRASGTYPITLEGAHIIPHHLSVARTELEVIILYFIFLTEREQKSKVWQALGIFAGPEVRRELDGQNIDALDNILVLEHSNHVAFGKLDLWFTADEVLLFTVLSNIVQPESISR
jgi:hypothetical protein